MSTPAETPRYTRYVHYRILGATLAGLAFVIPSFLMVVALGWAYVRFGGISWMQAVFYGVGAAVIGIIAMSAKKLTEKSVGKDKLLWAIYLLLLAAVTAITGSVIVIAKRSIIDMPTALIALTTVVLLWKFKKLQEPIVIAAAAVVGLILYPLLRV